MFCASRKFIGRGIWAAVVSGAESEAAIATIEASHAGRVERITFSSKPFLWGIALLLCAPSRANAMHVPALRRSLRGRVVHLAASPRPVQYPAHVRDLPPRLAQDHGRRGRWRARPA